MRLSIAQAVGLVSEVAWHRRPAPRGFVPSVDPRLVATYVPALHSPPPCSEPGPPDEFWGRQARLFGPWPDHGPMGLSSAWNPDTRDDPYRRNGLKGLSALGRRRLQEGCSLLEERKQLCVMWTISLGDEEHRQMRELDSWWRFQGAVRHRLVRLLRRRGMAPLVCGVAELHPKRSLEAGQAIPHLHIVFRNWRGANGQWVISLEMLDRIIAQGLAAAGVVGGDPERSGNVSRIRRSVRRYVSKYVTKTTRQAVAGHGSAFIGDPNGCPRQWWFCSKLLLQWIRCSTKPIPPEFLAWLADRRREPRRGAPVVVQRVEVADARAPNAWRIQWRSPWAFFRSWEEYERALVLGERPALRFRQSHIISDPDDRFHDCECSLRDQHL